MKLLVFGVCLALTVFLTFDKYLPKEKRINVVICAMVLGAVFYLIRFFR
ncbi:hypothetical protein ES703_06886 [subsurface metagenome]